MCSELSFDVKIKVLDARGKCTLMVGCCFVLDARGKCTLMVGCCFLQTTFKSSDVAAAVFSRCAKQLESVVVRVRRLHAVLVSWWSKSSWLLRGWTRGYLDYKVGVSDKTERREPRMSKKKRT